MKNLFEQSRSHWVRYDRYELKTAADGKRYITPAKDAKPDVYNPMNEMPGMVLDALNVGMLMMGRRTDVDVDAAILEFVTKYGLLGLMTALPTTPSFMDYEAVYLPKNHFIKVETMETEDYLALFYPFEQLDVVKKGRGIRLDGFRRPHDDRLDHDLCRRADGENHELPAGICGTLRLDRPAVQRLGFHADNFHFVLP